MPDIGNTVQNGGRRPVLMKSSQSLLKEISPEYSLEGLMLKLKLQSFSHLMRRTWFTEKTLILGKIEGRRRRGWQKMRWLDGITDSMDMSLNKLRKLVMGRKAWVLQTMGSQSQTWLNNWTEWGKQTISKQMNKSDNLGEWLSCRLGKSLYA